MILTFSEDKSASVTLRERSLYSIHLCRNTTSPMSTTDIEKKVLALYQQGYSQRAIERLLGISRKTIRRILLRYGVEIRVHYRKLDWSKRETIAYLLGVLLGDGYVREDRTRGSYRVGISVRDRALAEKVYRALQEVGLKPNFRETRDHTLKLPLYRVEACSREMRDLLLEVRARPECVLEWPLSCQSKFLEGFYEAEGSCKLRYSTKSEDGRTLGWQLRVLIAQKNERLIEVIKRILHNFGIEDGVYVEVKKSGTRVLTLVRKVAVVNFFRYLDPVIKNPKYVDRALGHRELLERLRKGYSIELWAELKHRVFIKYCREAEKGFRVWICPFCWREYKLRIEYHRHYSECQIRKTFEKAMRSDRQDLQY